MKMSSGDHRHIKLKEQDTVILSSTPIPESGNDMLIGAMVDDLVRKNVHVFEHRNHDLDGVGPLHVSGHASRDEYVDMIQMTKPKFFIPVYGAFRVKQRHLELAVEQGIPRANAINAENGDVIALTPDKIEIDGRVPSGTALVDQTGMLVSNVVIKDRLMLAEEGLVAVVLTIDKKNGNLLTSPDIISRGFIYMRDQEELMNLFRTELKRAVQQRFKRIDLDRFKAELKDHVTHFLFEHTGGSPIVIPVVNVISGGNGGGKPSQGTNQQGQGGQPAPNNQNGQPTAKPGAQQPAPTPEPVPPTPDEIAAEQQKRFEEMRARLLGQDARVD
jgi:ribonuclease J